jgi:hypothetical protein
MRNPRLTLILGIALIAGICGLSAGARAQDEDPLEVIRRAEERASQQRAQQEAKEQQALRDWADRDRQQSEQNLDRAIRLATDAKKRENEVKFVQMQNAVRELVAVSQRMNDQINASGAQSVSVTFFSDLDKLDKLTKRIRAAAK